MTLLHKELEVTRDRIFESISSVCCHADSACDLGKILQLRIIGEVLNLCAISRIKTQPWRLPSDLIQLYRPSLNNRYQSHLLKELKAGPSRTTFVRAFGAVLKNKVERLIGQRPTYLRKLSVSSSDTVAVTTGGLIDICARSRSKPISYQNFGYFFSKLEDARFSKSEVIELSRELCRNIFDREIIEQYQISKSDLSVFRQDLETALAASNIYLNAAIATFSQRSQLLEEVWTGSGAQIWTRFIRYAARDSGISIIGHDHALGGGQLQSVLKTTTEFDLISKFITFSDAQKDALKSMFGRRTIFANSLPEINKMSPYRLSQSHKTSFGKIGYVSGFGDSVHIGFKPRLEVARYFSLQKQVLGELVKQTNYEITYRGYPGHDKYSRILLNSLKGRVTFDSSASISELFDSVDVVILDSHSTTVLKDVLCFNKPCVLLYTGIDPLRDDALCLLKKGIEVIDISDHLNNVTDIRLAVNEHLERAKQLYSSDFAEIFLGAR